MSDFSALAAALDALQAKVEETDATLVGLANAVLALKSTPTTPADEQAAIDALREKAEAILARLTASEDAADDQLPA